MKTAKILLCLLLFSSPLSAQEISITKSKMGHTYVGPSYLSDSVCELVDNHIHSRVNVHVKVQTKIDPLIVFFDGVKPTIYLWGPEKLMGQMVLDIQKGKARIVDYRKR